MRLNDLKPTPGSHKKKTRVGRGISAGKGKTAGRGTKGQNARSGGVKGAYFEGGQLPLVRRLPLRRGFTNIFRVNYAPVNVDRLERAFKNGDEVNPQTLAKVGLIKNTAKPVVILGRGDLNAALTVKAHRFSTEAKVKIEAAGGKAEVLPLS